MRNLAKITMMLAFLAVVVGCNTEENYQVIEPEDTTLDARVVGHIHGVVMDGANNALLEGVEVELTRGGESWTYTTTAGGHYTFANVVPGTYSLSFRYPEGDGYGTGVNGAMIPEINDLVWEHGDDNSWPYPTDRDFHYEVVCDMRLFPLTGTVTGFVKSRNGEIAVDGRTVMADFANPYMAPDMFTTVTNADGSYTFTGLPVGMEMNAAKADDGGAGAGFAYGMMPESFDSRLRVVPVNEGGVYYTAYPVDLNLQWGEWVAEDLVLEPAGGPQIVMKNFADDEDARFPLDGTFMARFNVPMDPEVFVAELEHADGTYALLEVSWTDEMVLIDPTEDLDAGTTYTLTLSGVSLGMNQEFHAHYDIQTVGFTDPAVVADNFDDGGRRVPIDTALMLHFNTLMSDADYNIALYYGDVAKDAPDPAVEVPVTVDVDGNGVTITPTAALMYDTAYRLVVEMMTIGGVPFEDEWTFTTEELALPVFNYEFEDGVEFPVPVDANLVVTFPMAVDPASVIIEFDELYAEGALWSEGNTVLTIDPMVDFDYETTYDLGVSVLYAGTEYGFNNTDDPWEFTTINDGQGVRVIDHNLVDYFALDGIPSVTFSTAMDPLTFTSTYGGFVTLEQDGEVLDVTTAWTVGNTVLTITPDMPFLPNADLELALRGQSVDGVQLTDAAGDEDELFEFSTINMDAPTIVATNVVDGEFQPYIRVAGDPVVINPPVLEFTFSVAMDIETVEFDLWRDAVPDPIAIEGADPVWSEGNTVVTFTPYVRLLPLQTYFVGISGESVDGVELDGGLNNDDVANIFGYGYFYPFDTAGGLQFLRHDIFRIDGDNTNIPADDPRMVLYFNAPEYGEVIDLDADGTLVTLTNLTVADDNEVAIEVSYDEVTGALTLTPVNMPLDFDTQYEITYTLFTTLPGDEISTDDPDVDSIVFFTGPETTQTPVVQVDGLLQVADYTADFNTSADIELLWNAQDNADGYYVYARVDDGTELKDDYLRIDDVDVVWADADEDGVIEATVDIDAATFLARFDTRDTDTPYTPFDDQAILFRVAAYNDLGEGVKSDFVRVSDEVGPSGGVWAGQFEDDGVTPASADNSAGAEDVTIYLAFEANEYLDTTVEADAIIEITENFTESLAGDPNWFLTPEDVEITYEDMDGYTAIVLALTIPAGFNAAGDLVTLLPGSLKDTTGNDYADEDPVTWTLLDTTAPSGILMDEDPLVAQIGSADNTNDLLPGGAVARTFDVTFIARELLNPAAAPTLYLDGVDVFGNPNIRVDAVTYDPAVIDDTVTDTFSTVTVTFEVDFGFSFADDVVTISDLEDIARDVDGNPAYNASGATEMPEAVEDQWTLEDRTPPAASVSGQAPGSADNSGGGVALTVAYTITALEDCVDQDIEFRIFQSDGETQVIPPAANINLVGWSDPQTYEFEIDVPAGEDWTDYIIEFWNIEDLQGNAVSSDEPYTYIVQ